MIKACVSGPFKIVRVRTLDGIRNRLYCRRRVHRCCMQRAEEAKLDALPLRKVLILIFKENASKRTLCVQEMPTDLKLSSICSRLSSCSILAMETVTLEEWPRVLNNPSNEYREGRYRRT